MKAALAPAPTTPKFCATRAETLTINKIVVRYLELVRRSPEPTVLDLCMDLEACHCNGCVLDLAALHRANSVDLVHDVGGINTYLDRETGKLTDCFWPRYATGSIRDPGSARCLEVSDEEQACQDEDERRERDEAGL